MTEELTTAPPAPPALDLPLLVPGDRFFVTLVPLAAGTSVAIQVELALEEVSPFPLSQLYYGFITAPDAAHALGFAAYRRRMTAGETDSWPQAAAVIPSFLGLIGAAPAEPCLVLHEQDGLLTGLAWNGRLALPVAVVAHATTDGSESDRDSLVDELRERSGLTDAPVQLQTGLISVEPDPDGGARFRVGSDETGMLDAAELADADVREKVFLEQRRRRDRQERMSWRVLVAGLVMLGGALLIEAAALAVKSWNESRRSRIAAQAGEVERIQTAQLLATRIEDLANRRMRAMEMLAVAAEARPRAVQFLRATMADGERLEIEAQTANAGDVGSYEAALRALPRVQTVEARDLRSRGGMTTFVLAVLFRPDAWSAEGGQP